jgi:hypothetical protein
VKKAASAKASGKSQEEASVDRPPAQFWRTTGYTRLAVPLNGVLGGKTAKAFESLKLRTVGDLMLHLPRRYVSGTELSDLRNLTEGDDVLGGLRAGRTSISAGPGAPLLLRRGDEFLIVDGDGLLLATPDGRRTVVDGARVLLPAEPGLAWLEDGHTGIQAISA